MNEVEQKFRQYFKPYELVSPLHYTDFDDKDDIYSLFDDKLKAVIVYIRETINKPFVINNWKRQGQFQYRGYRDWETDRKSTRLNSSHSGESRMPSSA